MKYFFAFILLAPWLCFAQQRAESDTSLSTTKLYVALTTRNALYQREEYQLDTRRLDFTAIVLKSLTDPFTVKGCRTTTWLTGRINATVPVFFDENEIADIITTLQYIKDNINLEEKPDHDVWVYYTTADNFEIGAKADKGKKYRIYFRKNFRFVPGTESTLSRKDLDEVYNSFVYVRDFLKIH